MTAEKEKPGEIQVLPDIEIIGKGNIGEKARQLVEKTPFLKSIGFRVPRRTILAQDFFDGFFQRNGLGKSLTEVDPTLDLETRIRRGSFSMEDFKTLQRTFSTYEDRPLVVRSSGEGDARGTGIYKSEFTENRVGEARKALQKVLASYFSKNAIVFRKDAKTDEGFGIIIEPLISQNIDDYFGPILSGFGYTSTSSDEGFVNIVVGISGGVDTRDGERITRSQILSVGGNLQDYRLSQVSKMNDGLIPLRRSAFLRTDRNDLSSHRYYTSVIYIPKNTYQRALIYRKEINLFRDDKESERCFDGLNFLPFFDRINVMEEKFKKPQYFEWAMTIDGSEPRYWIIQIADVNKKLDIMDFENFGEPLLEGHTVTGTGIINCSKFVFCPGKSAIESLREFNRHNKNYLVIYSSKCTAGYRFDKNSLDYGDISNASVLMEYQENVHADDKGNPLGHLRGQLDMTGKLFGVIAEPEKITPKWAKLLREARKDVFLGFTVLEGKIKVVSSEKQNRIVIFSQD